MVDYEDLVREIKAQGVTKLPALSAPWRKEVVTACEIPTKS